MPRQILAGPILLDLFHRDARVGRDWLRLHPREFGLLWHLAEHPFVPHSKMDLLRDVWRLDHDPETNRVAVTVARVRAKLSLFGFAHLIATDLHRRAYFLACDAHAVASG
ncbi:winged helix-turn-helix domain-containing protein [Parerythrobacter lacustris]|uniref:Winged helix-turn-helix domain-containing protein n=1 Tax=Parerythrobacter lacustris TaxID=2969984 RepID=A0ABT1XM58_9SPHN|nr:winged helix-turn-helix domain-containing protein [Parerythrobacter lacustris]MCR2832750.1 winged helix-turn-helix domain-containing protein [Parerythrobacter lacustris]